MGERSRNYAKNCNCQAGAPTLRSVGLQADDYCDVGRLRFKTSAWTPTLLSLP